MATVNTVLGPVDTADFGFTLSHEHVGTNAAGLRHTYPEFIDREGIVEQSTAAMKEVYDEAGVRTIIDVSTFDLGRDVEMIRRVAEGSGMQVVAATGNHLAVPRPFGDVSPDVIAELYVREIEEGIEGTGVKAGVIKVASDRGGITPPARSGVAGGGPDAQGHRRPHFHPYLVAGAHRGAAGSHPGR